MQVDVYACATQDTYKNKRTCGAMIVVDLLGAVVPVKQSRGVCWFD